MSLVIKPGCTTEVEVPATGLVVRPGCTPTVNPLLTSKLAIYYKFDSLTDIVGGELDGFQGTPDALGNCDLNTGNSSGLVVASTGKISGAINLPLNHINIGLNSFSPTQFTAPQKALFNLFGQSFTMRFWIKRGPGDDDIFMELRTSGSNQWRFVDRFADSKISFRFYGQTIVSNEAVPNDGEFHRVIVSRDFAGAMLSIKIDDNPTLTVAYTGFDSNDPIDFFFIGNDTTAFDIDEWALWKDYVLTEDDMTYDWNSGAGKTVPFA